MFLLLFFSPLPICFVTLRPVLLSAYLTACQASGIVGAIGLAAYDTGVDCCLVFRVSALFVSGSSVGFVFQLFPCQIPGLFSIVFRAGDWGTGRTIFLRPGCHRVRLPTTLAGVNSPDLAAFPGAFPALAFPVCLSVGFPLAFRATLALDVHMHQLPTVHAMAVGVHRGQGAGLFDLHPLPCIGCGSGAFGATVAPLTACQRCPADFAFHIIHRQQCRYQRGGDRQTQGRHRRRRTLLRLRTTRWT